MSGYSMEIPTGGWASCSPGPVSSPAVSASVGGGFLFFFFDWWVGAWAAALAVLASEAGMATAASTSCQAPPNERDPSRIGF